MSKRVALPKAIRVIREAKLKQAQTDDHNPKDFTGAAVATKALMSYAHLLNIESGHRRATDDSIELLAKALGVEIDAISYEVENKAAA